MAASVFSKASPIAKIEVIPSSGNPYYIEVQQAKALVANGDAKWSGPKRVIRVPDKSKRGIWAPQISGFAGPLVMQLT